MELRTLEYFLAVAREESILRASNYLHLTQPTLSRQMHDLEEELGKQLFIRGNRKITLTEDGVLFRQRANEILMLVRKTRDELSAKEDAVCGAFMMVTDTMMYSFSGLGIFAILGMLNPENPNVIVAVLCAVVPFVFSFILAFVLYREKAPVAAEVQTSGSGAAAAPAVKVSGPVSIEAPIPGKVVPIEQVPDETFSTGVLGVGFAVEPSEGKVYAPFDGECENMFDTFHAMGLNSDTGVSLLIHVGLETVSLNGKPFKPHVKSGDRIKKGQLLLEFDMDMIKASGCPTQGSALDAERDL